MTDAPDDPIARAQLIVAHDDEHAFQAVVPSIVQTSLFTFRNVAEMMETYAGRKSRDVYSRTTNPTVTAFERKMAALEGTDGAIGFPSGMAAISGAVLSRIKPGDRIVSVRHVYPDAYRLFEGLLKSWGVTTTYVDGRDIEAVAAALPGAAILYLESPTSWTMEAHDVGALAALARAHGVTSMIDNSWATPVLQRPAALIDHIRRTICPYIGAKLAPFEAWLLLRGLRTLPARVQAHGTSARIVAERLRQHPLVSAVHLPGLTEALPPGLWGNTGLFSFEAAPGLDIKAFCDALQCFKLGVSWGGHESLVVPALVTRVQAAGPNSAVDFAVPERMIRLHVGLEGTEALWNDLERAFAAARHTAS